ncbi:MAG: DUF473 domain-containing protein [Methanocalculus sp. MSAO_Arc1]|uniref:DUF473 domain-containing protein n=1 Tax=Methanocalculus TaxID=71151 RepID=UPI000FF51ADA|nr:MULTISPECIES: DUF473 domain-containing protein [unclassified Methanocalculus]MCP1662021.1 hypothetical protein [Methanocalculus sp. AMF5]RQD79613.1 MAG: DUF473 domain-containing protein [Methanocalculus sp. MSAO_Arc1]
MNVAALTGISPQVITDLKQGKPRTIELQSAHNIVTLSEVNPGDHLFLTHVAPEDLSTGDSGIILEVQAVSISMKRMVEFSHGSFFEERERTSARVKLRYCGTSIIKSVIENSYCKATTVDVIKCTCFHAV